MLPRKQTGRECRKDGRRERVGEDKLQQLWLEMHPVYIDEWRRRKLELSESSEAISLCVMRYKWSKGSRFWLEWRSKTRAQHFDYVTCGGSLYLCNMTWNHSRSWDAATCLITDSRHILRINEIWSYVWLMSAVYYLIRVLRTTWTSWPWLGRLVFPILSRVGGRERQHCFHLKPDEMCPTDLSPLTAECIEINPSAQSDISVSVSESILISLF